MFKTKFTAIFLCLTMLFFMFAGEAYADDGVTYIGETTLVIKDGKVVSGDKSLISNGIVVIADDDSSDAEYGDYTEEDSFGNEDPFVKINGETASAESALNSSLPTTENVTTEQTKPQTGKQPVKDNSALVKPENSVAESQGGSSVPENAPTAVNPNIPQEGILEDVYINHPSLGATQNDWFDMTMYYDYIYVYQTQKVEKTNVTVSALTYHTTTISTVFYRLKDAHSNAGPSGTGTFSGIMFDVTASKTFNLTGNADHKMYIDGRLCSSNTSGTFLPSSPTAVSRTNPQVSSPLMRVSGSGAKLNLTHVVLRNSNATGNGGGVRVGDGGTLKMNNCTIDNCDTTGNGGGIYIASGGSVELTNVTIKNCKAAYGGAIYVAGNCTLKMNTVTIQDNIAENSDKTDGNGGGMWIGASDTGLTIGSTVTFDNNTANNNGGAIALARKRKLTINGAEFKNNDAKKGGAISVYSANDAGDPTLILDLGKIHDNTASEAGGGVYIAAGAGHQLNNTSSTVNNSSIYNNSAPKGGGICVVKTTFTGVSNGKITLNKGKLYGNNNSQTGTTYGGGVYVDNGGTVDLKGTIIGADSTTNGNKATNGAGVYVAAGGTFTMNSGEIRYNVATKHGGGIHNNGGSLTLSGGNINNNEASNYGGGMYICGGGSTNINASNATLNIYNNTASADGGGITVGNEAGDVTVNIGGGANAVNIYSNTAKRGGGIRTLNSGSGNMYVTVASNTAIYKNTANATSSDSYPGGGGVFIGGNCEFTMTGGKIGDTAANTNNALYGGGIFLTGGKLTISGGSIQNHTGIVKGAGIYAENNSTLIIEGSASINGNNANTSSCQGGGIYAENSTITINGGTISNNVANFGGGFNIDSSTSMTISGGTISGNTATNGNGGGGWIGYVTKFEMSGCDIYDNDALGSAEGIGGGLFFNRNVAEGTVTITGGNIHGNTAERWGGGLYFGNGSSANEAFYATLGGVEGKTLKIYENTAVVGGGVCVDDGVALADNAFVNITIKDGTEIYENTATNTTDYFNYCSGAGVHVNPSGIINIEGGVIRDNHGTQHGVGVSINGGLVTMTGGEISGNDTAGEFCGGGVYLQYISNERNYNKFIMEGGKISNNYSKYGGGVFVNTNTTVELKGGEISNNDAKYGGGVYVAGNFEMSGGSITENQATGSGGGVIIDVGMVDTITASFIMTGGAISSNHNTATEDAGNGGGIWVGKCITFKIEGNGTTTPVISGNTTAAIKENTNGAGIFINRSVSNPIVIKNCTISNNVCQGVESKGGGICFSNTGLVSNNTATIENVLITGNKAAAGGGISINGNNVYDYTISVTMSGLDVVSNEAYSSTGENHGGGIHVSGNKAKVSLSDSAITNNTADDSGGGIYLFNTKGTAGDAISFSNVKVNDNTCTNYFGGGICVDSVVLNLTGNNEINGNTANAWGGGIIVRAAGGTGIAELNINMTDAGVTTINNNTVGEYGGGVHVANVGAVRFNMKGGEICGNACNNAYGGGIDTQGTTTLNGTTISNNQAFDNGTSALGGGIIARGEISTLTLTNCTVSDNIAQYGGGIMLKEYATATITGGTISGNIADEAGGLLVYDNSSATVSGLTVSDNSTINGDGGGVMVAILSSLTMTDSYIINNTANGNYTGTTAKTEEHTLLGAGGGVAVFDSSTFVFNITNKNGAIYGNTASTAGNDVFANGIGTQLTLPAPDAMDTTIEEGYWMEDYMKNDSCYEEGLNGNNRIIERYALSPISVRAYSSSAEVDTIKDEYINDANQFVAITFDVPKYSVGSIQITAPTATDENQVFVYTVSGETTLGDRINLTISIPAGETVKITQLIAGSYTVAQQTAWSWRYDTTPGDEVETDPNGSVIITITGTEFDEVHEIEYTGDRVKNQWLSHNSPVVPNTATVDVVYTFDIAEANKGALTYLLF